MSLPTDKRNYEKTKNSSLANFLHQQNAYIGMQMANYCKSKKMPLYTVPDNFISTPSYEIPKLYKDVWREILREHSVDQ